MEKVETTTTDFRKALKTVLDTLTEKEQKTYDVGIELVIAESLATIRMEHPTEKMIVSASFPSTHDCEVRTLFYLGDLEEDLKHFRKKEALWIQISDTKVEFSVADGRLYEATVDVERITTLFNIDYSTLSRQAFIDCLNLAQGITKRSFHASTSAVQFALTSKTLYAKTTNFAQLYIGEMTTDSGPDVPAFFSLSAHLITKVRNVVERDKGDSIRLTVFRDWVSIETMTTSVAFAREYENDHLDAKGILAYLSFGAETYPLSTESIKEETEKRYKKWRDATEDKVEEVIEANSHVSLHINDETVVVADDLGRWHIYTKDLKTLLAKMTGEWTVQIAEVQKTLLMQSIEPTVYCHKLLVPMDDTLT